MAVTNSQTPMENEQPVRYAVKVGTQIVTSPQPSQMLAEQSVQTLPEDQQRQAQVVPVTADGRELLME